jgi:hypothetical protein
MSRYRGRAAYYVFGISQTSRVCRPNFVPLVYLEDHRREHNSHEKKKVNFVFSENPL